MLPLIRLLWAYLTGFGAGICFILFILLRDPAIVVIGAAWLLIGIVARKVNR